MVEKLGGRYHDDAYHTNSAVTFWPNIPSKRRKIVTLQADMSTATVQVAFVPLKRGFKLRCVAL